jgi:hypothetical protein
MRTHAVQHETVHTPASTLAFLVKASAQVEAAQKSLQDQAAASVAVYAVAVMMDIEARTGK